MQDLIDEISNQLYEQFGIEKGISKRTFHYDIDLMRSLPPRGFDAPIKVRDGFYSYEDPDFSINNIELSETDIETINNALTLLNNFSKLSINEELALVKAKLQGEVGKNEKKKTIILFEQREVKGGEYISPLYKAISDNSSIQLSYKPFKADKVKSFIVHPYLLKQYNHRWYLIGYSSAHCSIGLYSLDRIEEIQSSDEKFIPNTFINIDSYFKDIVGVTLPQNEEPKEIQIKVSKSQSPYILTKPLHCSQIVVSEDSDGLTIGLVLIPNYEFFSLLMSYGDTLEILSPKNIRNQMVEIIRKTLHVYD